MARASAISTPAQWQAPDARSTRRRPTAWCRSRRTTTSASPTIPRSSPPRTTPSTAGAPAPARRGSSWARARCTTSSRSTLADWKAHRGGGAVHHRVRRQPRRAHHVRRPRRAGVLRRAQPRVDHRRSAARRRAARGLPPPRRRATSTSSCGRTPHARAIVVSETVFSMDGDVAPVDKLARRVRAPRRAAGARRGPQRARARPVRAPRRRRRAAGGHAVEDARRARRLRGRATPLHRPAGEPRPLVHLHHRVEPGRRRRRARRARVLRSPEGDALRGPPARQRRPAAAGPPVAGRCRTCAAASTRALEAAAALARRAASSSPPSGPRRCRRARRGCGSRSRPPTPPTRSTRSPPRWPSCSPHERGAAPRTLVFVAGTATEVGKTWWTAAVARGAPCRRACTSPPASRCSRAIPATPPTPTCSPPRPARIPTPCARRRARCRWRGHRPWPHDELGLPPFTTADLAGGIDWPAIGRRRSGRGGRRAPLADQRRRRQRRPRARARARRRRRSSPTRGWAPSTRCGSSAGALADFPVVVALNRFAGRARRPAARPQPRAPHRRRRLRRGDRAPRSSPIAAPRLAGSGHDRTARRRRPPRAQGGRAPRRDHARRRARARGPRRRRWSSSTTPARARRSATTTSAPPGAEIAADADAVWARADLVLKVKEPQPDELDQLRPGLVLFTYLHLAAYPQVADALLAHARHRRRLRDGAGRVGRAPVARAR